MTNAHALAQGTWHSAASKQCQPWSPSCTRTYPRTQPIQRNSIKIETDKTMDKQAMDKCNISQKPSTFSQKPLILTTELACSFTVCPRRQKARRIIQHNPKWARSLHTTCTEREHELNLAVHPQRNTALQNSHNVWTERTHEGNDRIRRTCAWDSASTTVLLHVRIDCEPLTDNCLFTAGVRPFN